jgi:hypothetical protein
MQTRTLYLAATLLCLVALFSAAQETRGTIVGRVTDPSGAVIPNAKVEVLNKAMGTVFQATTNAEGLYTVPLLLPGQYMVTVTQEGFKKFVRDNVELRVADRLEVNATLQVGGAQESITITESTPLLGTETASIGAVIGSQQIMDLPLSYGNPFALIAVSTGTGFMGSPRLDRPFEPTHIANFSMNGSRGDRSDITLDGAPATATANAGEVIASYVPPTDILAEFKVQTATFDAAVGNTEGGVTNLSVKSGTNELHGTAYYSLMRKAFWANDFFNNKLGRERPDFRFDRWGAPGSIGGPVYIPKLYNGKNRTFFLFGLEGIHDSRPRYDSNTPQVPTPAMKNGDFSALLALGPQYQIYNPFTRRQVGSRFVEDPFPGNMIPSSLFNPVGKAILDKYYPAPTSPGNPDGTSNLLQPDLAEKTKYYNWTARIDHNISERQRLYGRYSTYRRDSTYNDYFHNEATGSFFQFFSHNAVLDDTLVLSPTTVLDLRYGYNRFIRAQDGDQDAIGFDLTTLGFPASYNNLIPADIRRFPRIDLAGYIGTGFSGEYRPVDTHSFSAALTKTAGSHSLRGGFDWRAYRENDVFFSNDQTGRFNFDTTYTRGPQDNSPAAPNNLGQSVAALLMGLPSSSNSYVSRTASYAEQSMTWGFYFQDDWKVTPKLTLNLGLRYEFESPLTERFNRTVQSFDPTYVQPFAAAAQAAYALNPAAVPADQFQVRGGLVYPTGDGSTGLYNTPKTNFMPRFGFAYQLPKNTVVRGGFGIYDGFLGQRRGDVITTGFTRQTPFNAFGPDDVTIVRTLADPFPDGILEPVGAGQGYQTNVGQNISFFNQNPRTPTNYRWQLNLQHEFRRSLLVEASYVGNKAVRIEVTRNINALPVEYLSTLPTRDNEHNAWLTASVPNPFYGLDLPPGTPSTFLARNISRQQLLRPYPEFGAINTTTNEGYSWYHGLQLRVEKRFGKGLSLIGNYTFSKFMQATELLNNGDPAPTRMISDQDVPHRLTASWIYALPFGKGRRFLSSLGPVADRIVGGWEITGLWTFQSGTPLAFGSYSQTSATNNGDFFFADASQAVIPVDERSPDRWFNPGAFVTAASAQPVAHLRVNPYRFSWLRGPRQNNVDMALIKDTRITERTTMRFSAQALNAFNHPLFSSPQMTVTSAQFGTMLNSSTQNNYPRRLQLELKFIF